MLDTPFFSQRLTADNYQADGFATLAEAKHWTKRICGLACLKMVIAKITGQVVTLNTLLQQGLAADGYMKGVGWIHQSLADVAYHHYGIRADCQSIGASLDPIEEALGQNTLVIASVSCGFKPEKKGGHLVVILAMDKEQLIIHHPSSHKNEQWSHYRLGKSRFLQCFSENGNIITVPTQQTLAQ